MPLPPRRQYGSNRQHWTSTSSPRRASRSCTLAAVGASVSECSNHIASRIAAMATAMPSELSPASSHSEATDPDLHVPLPCLPASDRQRLRIQARSHRIKSTSWVAVATCEPPTKVSTGLFISAPTTARPCSNSFDSTGCRCRPDRRISTGIPATDDFGVRFPTASGRYERHDGTSRLTHSADARSGPRSTIESKSRA